MKSLIVEDDFASRLVLQAFLSRYGECHIAVNGKEAVDAFRSAVDAGPQYDLICMDILMPEMDGQAALRAIRAEEASRPSSSKRSRIIMTTALSSLMDVSAAYQGMCDGYLIKPIDLGKLREEITDLGLASS